MITRVEIKFSAENAERAINEGDIIIAIDVLRASTSILNALFNGARLLIPVNSLKESYGLHRQHPEYLLAGERGGRKPRYFDMGNSPLEFAPEKVRDKSLIITTTNGTKALIKYRKAKWVLIGAFLNAKAVAEKAVEIAAKEDIGVSFVLAGTRGGFSLEDFLCAGAIASEFDKRGVHISDKVRVSLLAYKQAAGDLKASILDGKHAKDLVKLGFQEDIDFSSQLDKLAAVPICKGGRIVLS